MLILSRFLCSYRIIELEESVEYFLRDKPYKLSNTITPRTALMSKRKKIPEPTEDLKIKNKASSSKKTIRETVLLPLTTKPAKEINMSN